MNDAGFLSGDLHGLQLLMDRVGCIGFFNTAPCRRQLILDLPTQMGAKVLQAFKLYVRAQIAMPRFLSGRPLQRIFTEWAAILDIMTRTAWLMVARKFVQHHAPVRIMGFEGFGDMPTRAPAVALWYRQQHGCAFHTLPHLLEPEVPGGAWRVGRQAARSPVTHPGRPPYLTADGPPLKKPKGARDQDPEQPDSHTGPPVALGLLAGATTDPLRLPHLDVPECESAQAGPSYHYVRLSTRVDLDRLLAAMHHCELFSDVTTTGEGQESYRVAPWAHVNPYRISFVFHWTRIPWLNESVIKIVTKQIHSNLRGPLRGVDLDQALEEPRYLAGITDDWAGLADNQQVSTSGAKLYVQALARRPTASLDGTRYVGTLCIAIVAALLEETDLDRAGIFVTWADGTRVPYGAPEVPDRLNVWDPRNARDAAGLLAARPRSPRPCQFHLVDLPIVGQDSFAERLAALQRETLASWNRAPDLDVYALSTPGPLLPQLSVSSRTSG